MNMKALRHTIILSILFIICISHARSQDMNYLQFDPVVTATGLTGSNSMSYFYNPSLLNRIEVPTLSFSAAPSRFGLSELSPGFMMFGLPVTDDLVTAISGFAIGNDLYSEFSGSLHGAYSISEFLDIGASFEYFQLHIKDYHSDDSYQFHIGANVRISDLLYAGVCVKNINGNHYFGGDKTIDQAAAVGFGFQLSEELAVDLGLQVNTIGQSGISLAGLYSMKDVFNLRLSALTSPRLVSGAVSILALPYFDINILSSYHDYLGWNHSFGLSVYFGSKDE
jgi:hypothetical protein